MYNMQRTIVAQCTPIGSGTLAVIRISGPQSLQIVDQLGQLANWAKISAQAANTISYGAVIESITAPQNLPESLETIIIDRVMFSVFRAPKSFTGENTVEISCHNNQLIINQIINLALKFGASLAQRGEFSQQAFLNQKLDLTQVEALNELIHANTDQALKKSLAQLDGSLSSWLVEIEAQLLQALALSEASFEFLDEEFDFGPQILVIIEKLELTLRELQVKFSQDQQLRTGIKIAIIGPPNAGKSSLFNKLVQQERAIVTEIAGTTRDTIEAGWQLGEYLVTFVDTAGLRKTIETIEQLGITRSLQAAQTADVILLVFDSTRDLTSYTATELAEYQALIKLYSHKILLVLNKCDLDTRNIPRLCSGRAENKHLAQNITEKPTQLNSSLLQLKLFYSLALSRSSRTPLTPSDSRGGDVASEIPILVSAQTGANLDQLKQALENKIQSLLGVNNSPFLLNQRHSVIISDLLTQLEIIQKLLAQEHVAYELLSINLNQALVTISELTGKTISEQAMDKIFREFCVGK
jgi:tRNA modification GTPase